MPQPVKFTLAHADITTYPGDVAVLKYAAPYVLYLGVKTIWTFRYTEIEEFSLGVFSILAEVAPETRHILMTMHGMGYGLDEVEAMLAQFKGYLKAIETGQLPPHLEQITIVERNQGRVERLAEALDNYAQTAQNIIYQDYGTYLLTSPQQTLDNIRLTRDAPRTQVVEPELAEEVDDETEFASPASELSEAKIHAFVAMPFRKEMDDVFFYGIQQPLHNAGLLCERVDQDAFTGGIMDYVRTRIETAAVVVAELTGANPNVYLEVGYAWGKGRPVILLARDEKELHFDVRGQRCLVYERIKDLEESLSKELKAMILKGIVKL